MKAKLTRFEKLFLLSNNLMWTGGYVFDVILAFFIWGESENLNNLLVFKLFWTMGIVFGAFAAVVLLTKLNPLIVRIFSFLIAIAFALSLLVFSIKGMAILILLGILYGVKVGLGSQPYNFVYQILIRPENRTLFTSIEGGAYEVIMVFFPFIVTQILDLTENYDIVFILAVILTVLSIFPLLASIRKAGKTEGENEKQQTKTDFPGAISEIKNSNNLQNLLLLKFIDGIQNGFEISIFPVLGLFIVSDVGSWGIINTIIAVIGVILYFTISKKLKFAKAAPVFNVVALIYSVIALLFGIYLSFELYLLFLLALVLDKTMINTVYYSVDSKVIDRRIEEVEHLDEYLTLVEIPTFLGRILPLLALLLTGGKIDGITMSFILVIVAFIPMAMTYVLGRIEIVKHAEDPFIYSN